MLPERSAMHCIVKWSLKHVKVNLRCLLPKRSNYRLAQWFPTLSLRAPCQSGPPKALQ